MFRAKWIRFLGWVWSLRLLTFAFALAFAFAIAFVCVCAFLRLLALAIVITFAFAFLFWDIVPTCSTVNRGRSGHLRCIGILDENLCPKPRGKLLPCPESWFLTGGPINPCWRYHSFKIYPTVKWGEPGQLEPGHKQRKKMSSGSSSSDICLKPPDGRKFHSGFLFQAMEVHVNVVLFAP